MKDLESAIFLYEEAMGYTYAAALRAAVLVGVADHLPDGPRPVAELARETGADPGGLHRVLRLLAARGVFRETGDGRFELTDKGRALRSDAEVPARSGILMFTDTMFWTVTHEVATILRDSAPRFERIFGMSLDDYFTAHPDKEDLYYDGIEKVSDAENPLVARSYDFPPSGTVVDVGGRFGGFLLALLRAHPGLHGVLFDREPMLDRHRLDDPGIAGRWEIVSGDFYREVPPADFYVIKRNFHAYDDDSCVRILRTCRRAMKPDGRVLVIDAIVPPGNDPHPGKAMDYMMLANLIGGERSAAQLEPLFEAADLRLARVIRTPTPMSIAEGVPR